MKSNGGKSGFSLVVLIATVTIMMLLITAIVVSGYSSSNTTKKIAFGTEIASLQQSVDAYAIKNNGQYPVLDILKVDIKGIDPNTLLTQFQNNLVNPVNGYILLNTIDYEKLGISALKYGTGKHGTNDIYAIDPLKGKVFYAKGMKIGKKTYFTLTSELESLINYNTDQSGEVENTVVVFEASTTDWTNSNVELKAKIPKIPKEYIVTSITFNGNKVEKDINASNIDTSYNVYQVSATGNYTMTVKYKTSNNSYERTERYNVTNIDKEKPIIQFDPNNQIRHSSTEEKVVGYIPIDSIKDLASGIKCAKYTNETITDNISSYFKANGADITDNRIIIDKGVRNITVYIEDNAGNYYSSVIKINIGQ